MGATDTVVVALERVPFVLPEQRAVAIDRCDLRSDSATQELSLYTLSQLRLAAEHYEQFRRTYPFTLQAERRTIVFSRKANVAARESASLLFLASLADSAFWDRHCLVARAVEQ
jgi:hypothetical protein